MQFFYFKMLFNSMCYLLFLCNFGEIYYQLLSENCFYISFLSTAAVRLYVIFSIQLYKFIVRK